jgi:uncharacterized protein (TIGR02646 family)
MKNVLKSREPVELSKYKQRYTTQLRKWNKHASKKVNLKALIYSTLVSDQKGICAYCEIPIYEKACTVEHFIPCHLSNLQKNYDLDWQNMLGNCSLPGGITEDDLQNLPHKSPCCGRAKYDFIPDDRLLNPLELPTSRLFRFRSGDGKIIPDEATCEQASIPAESVQFTIDTLQLNVDRLKRHRKAVIDEINQEISERQDEITDQTLLEEQIASERIGNGKEKWPKFFTTIRWVLGEGAEKHLADISYLG